MFGTYIVNEELVSAETAADLEQQKATVDQEIEKYNQEVADLQQNLQKQVEIFQKTNEQIKQTDTEIVDTEKRIEDRTVIIGDRIVAYQKNDSNLSLYIDAIFGSDSLTNLVDRVSTVKTILDADKELIKEQETDKEKLQQTKKSLASLKEEQQLRFQEMQEQEEKLQVVISDNKAKSLALQAQIADVKEQEALKAARIKAEEEAKALQALQSVKANAGNEAQATKAGAVQAGTAGAIAEAKKYLGMSYTWGGSNPSTSFDCSGLVQWSYAKAGISLPRTASQQYLATTKISASEAKAGDLVFFSYGSGVAHVGIYLGNGQMLDAQNNGIVIESMDWWQKYLVGYGRV